MPVTKAEGERVAEHMALGFPRKEHFHSHFIAKAHPTTTLSIRVAAIRHVLEGRELEIVGELHE